MWVNQETGRPGRLVWAGIRYLVIGNPIPIKREEISPMLTHPQMRTIGFQVTVRSDAAEYTVDLMRDGKSWVIAAVYD
ncbi:hypothetical protein [Gryllotalpicola sp.]|uniref:hypothetical protein n=1 Tax=Gryllotalpicola sp. TaxID=1932787 RepID=UPI00260C7A16|nr:hypothetical protein [Gryllotalpicola sp.]